ncbi:Cystathionine beta-synthase [Portunus trituberculatus]|uniref:Cystathionine beta-synthase n=1 Tax=Portunus trituberculatus TaxID=210409 RepID=A0A5B7JEI4_PORTR|nr:Cystathionine beta-synthase [Portunus trituberculatus]
MIQGVVTLGSLMAKILSAKIEGSSPVQQSLYSQFRKIKLDTTLGKLSRILDRDHFALVVHTQRLCKYALLLLQLPFFLSKIVIDSIYFGFLLLTYYISCKERCY